LRPIAALGGSRLQREHAASVVIIGAQYRVTTGHVTCPHFRGRRGQGRQKQGGDPKAAPPETKSKGNTAS
jgi:hypothetical protein